MDNNHRHGREKRISHPQYEEDHVPGSFSPFLLYSRRIIIVEVATTVYYF